METIKSFTVDHKRLLPGVYVSRKDSTGHDVVTTFDIRMTRPNFEPVMNTAEIHTLEHLGATFLRNHEEWGDKIIYFGPMGCRNINQTIEKRNRLRILRIGYTGNVVRLFEGGV